MTRTELLKGSFMALSVCHQVVFAWLMSNGGSCNVGICRDERIKVPWASGRDQRVTS